MDATEKFIIAVLCYLFIIKAVIVGFILWLKKGGKKTKTTAVKPLNNHGLYEDDSYIPDWIYNGHHDCGDK